MAQPILFEGTARDVRLPPPLLGQHSRAVLTELDYTASEIDALVASKVVEEYVEPR